MLITNILPRPELSSVVRFYRIIHFNFKDSNRKTNNIKAYRPRIEHCLQFTPFDHEMVHYDNGKSACYQTALFGQHTVLTQRNVGIIFLNFQVVFQPGVLFNLCKEPVQMLTNEYIDANLVFKEQVKTVNEQLAHCIGYEQMIRVVEIFLEKLFKAKMDRTHPVCTIAKEMLNPYNYQKIEWYAYQSNLSLRQFNRMFITHTGIAPKDYRNLVRLDLAYLLKNRFSQKDWFSIAIESGFYDYQHLYKNYKKYTGYSPTEFYCLEQAAPERTFGYYEY